MQVVRRDDVGIYNLTKGKQLPAWIPDRKRRKLQQEDADMRVSVIDIPAGHCYLIRTEPR